MLNEQLVREIHAFMVAGWDQQKIAKYMGVHSTTISDIWTQTTWKRVRMSQKDRRIVEGHMKLLNRGELHHSFGRKVSDDE